MPHTETELEGVPIPSVTQVTGMLSKPFLYAWYGKWGNKLCKRKLEASGRIGDSFHDLVFNMVRGSKVTPPTRRLHGMCTSFEGWINENKFVPFAQELKVISHKYRYAGTLDALGYLGDSKELVILDWKSSAGIYPEMAYQLVAYAKAYQEEHPEVILNKGWIIQVDKKPPYKLHTRLWEDLDSKFNVFLGLLNAYNDLHPVKVKKPTKVKV